MSSDPDTPRQDEDVCQSSPSGMRTSEEEASTARTKRKRGDQESLMSPAKKMKLDLQQDSEVTSQSEAESSKADGATQEKLGSRPSLIDLKARKDTVLERLKYLQTSFGRKCHPIAEPQKSDTAWDYLLHEMVFVIQVWMAEDFDRERRLKVGKAKKLVRSSTAYLRNKQESELRQAKDIEKHAIIRSGKIARMVASYWRSVEKVAVHIKNLEIEEKEQELRTKRLDRFVEKQLKLTSEVAAGLVREHRPITIELINESGQWRVWGESDEAGYEAALALEMQPKGITLATSRVYCKMPFLLIGKLREYQHIGLDWLVTLHDKRLNGILADEMGLGKTIQTIALLAYLACERGIWGPHLIVVPTSIMINWEMELKRWCPGFKVLTYFGTQKERKAKRVGWSKVNSFHVCITSYKLIVQDQFAFRRKPWYYLILDEAQHIKNFQSMRWQVLSKFSSRRRLLLTGTPLQNDVIELWALLHFLMPHLFQSHDDFTAWFSNPFNQSFAQSTEFNMGIIQRLQSIIRPFILRRLKKDVETQLPGKFEHVVFCSMSRRQQYLYDEFLALRGNQETSEYMGIMNLLMQLRKVCNHPELFAPRFVMSPLRVGRVELTVNARCWVEKRGQDTTADALFSLVAGEQRSKLAFLRGEILIPTRNVTEAADEINASRDFWADMRPVVTYRRTGPTFDSSVLNTPNVASEDLRYVKRSFASITTLPSLDFLTKEDCAKLEWYPAKALETDPVPALAPLYGSDLHRIVRLPDKKGTEHSVPMTSFFGRKATSEVQDRFSDGNFPTTRNESLARLGFVKTIEQRLDVLDTQEMQTVLVKFQACPPKVLCRSPVLHLSKTLAREQVRN